jgi:hypothetical protein
MEIDYDLIDKEIIEKLLGHRQSFNIEDDKDGEETICNGGN